jgi:hypothetical protein
MQSSRVLFLVLAGSSGCGLSKADLADADARVLDQGVGFLVVESDRSVGGVEAIDPTTHARTTNTGTDFDADAGLRRLTDPTTGASRYFLVQATLERLLEIDRAGHVVAKFPVGDGGPWTDPQDVALASDGAMWVTRYGSKSVAVLEPDGRPRCSVDLSPFAPADGPKTKAPGMSAIAIVNKTAYVALRRLDALANPIEDSTVVAIDTTGCGPAKAFVTLPARNPWQRFVVAGTSTAPELWVNCIAGPLSTPKIRGGALVKIDLATAKASIAFSEDAAGGFVDSFDLVDDHTAFAIVASYTDPNPTTLIRFDPTTGARDASFRSVTTTGYTLWSVAKASSVILLADRREESPGIRILSTDDGGGLGFLPTRLPPVELLVLRE